MSPSRSDLKQHVRARRATNEDAEVGRRVRTRRMEKQLSQTDLGEQCGVTFQQIQKYEKGTNRIGAGRLARIAKALDVSVTYFFDVPKSRTEDGTQAPMESLFAQVQKRDAVQLLGYFAGIKSRTGRQTVVNMARELAGAA
jgi:transcriptional regulator with XRE-family HTH domain